MSEQTTEEIEIPRSGDAAFAALMDVLAPEEGGAPAGTGDAPAAAPAGDVPGAGAAGGAADTAGAGAVAVAPIPTAGEPGSAGTQAVQPDTRADGTPAVPAPVGGGDRPAAWTASAADLGPRLGDVSTAFEQRVTEAYQQMALQEVREEHVNYFNAISQHPRTMIGLEVPAIGKDGMETLQDAEDVRDWQSAVKQQLADEVRDRASRAMDEQADFINTIHASIDLFRNNADLIPGTRDFDVDLANRFAKMAEPYELRADDKLQGYSIPVQPLIDQLRVQVAAERAAGAASTPAPAATPPPAAAPASPPEQPQAGITSKAGSGTDTEDFSTLFGTIGLPNLQI